MYPHLPILNKVLKDLLFTNTKKLSLALSMSLSFDDINSKLYATTAVISRGGSSMKFIALRKDDYYIRELITLQKDCWHLNLDLSICTLYMVDYLKKRLFNSSMHPFICSFKEQLLMQYHQPVINPNEVAKILDLLYLYKGTLS